MRVIVRMWTEDGYHKDVAILDQEQVRMSYDGMECKSRHVVSPTDAELDARVQALSDEDVVLLADRNATSDLGYYRGFDVKIRLAQEVLKLRRINHGTRESLQFILAHECSDAPCMVCAKKAHDALKLHKQGA